MLLYPMTKSIQHLRLSSCPSRRALLPSCLSCTGRTGQRGGGGSEGDIRGFGESGDKRHGRHM
jgi:hypothetical protein